MFKNLSLNVKLSLPTIVLCAVAAAIGGVGYRALNNVSNEYSKITDKVMIAQNESNQLFSSYRKVRIQARTLGLKNLKKAQGEEAIKEALEAAAEVDRHLANYKALPMAPEEKELVDKLEVRWKEFKDMSVRIFDDYHSDKPEAQAALETIFFDECPRRAQKFTVELENLLSYQDKVAHMAVVSAHEDASSSQHLILWLIFGGLSVGVLLSIWSARSASSLVSSIAKIVTGMNEGANQMSEVSNALVSASESLSSSATQQASALQQTTAAVEETSAMVSKNADNAQRSSTVSHESQQSVSQGKQAVEEMTQAIQEISASNEQIMLQISHSNSEIGEIVKMITEIGNKTKVINDIVFQTKLLSFNASVEAARAGEQGKGFAVVAEEVGNLAQMSGNSAKEITDLLDVSIKKVQDIVSNTQVKVEQLVKSGSQKVKVGEETARRCGELLDVIVGNVTDVGARVSEIASASQEQANGLREINKAIAELDSSAQLNQQASQSASTSAEQLESQVTNLRQMVTNLSSLVAKKTEIPGKERPEPKAKDRPKTNVHPIRKSSSRTSEAGRPSSQDKRFREV
jgi:methyl-accepting chemotaxis protein